MKANTNYLVVKRAVVPKQMCNIVHHGDPGFRVDEQRLDF